MTKSKFIIGFLWSLPITAVCYIFYIMPFQLFGWYKYLGFHDVAHVWMLNIDKSPNMIKKMWSGWAGHALGNLIVLSEEEDIHASRTFLHEIQHVHQCMRLGIFQPIIYVICLFAIKYGCKNSHYYYSNPFEIDARRGAGQHIDIEGLIGDWENAK